MTKILEIRDDLADLGRTTIDGAIEKALGITGQQLYDEWKQWLVATYTARIKDVKTHPIIGDTIETLAFGNF